MVMDEMAIVAAKQFNKTRIHEYVRWDQNNLKEKKPKNKNGYLLEVEIIGKFFLLCILFCIFYKYMLAKLM